MAQLQASNVGTISATTLSGSGASLTSLNAGNITGSWSGSRLWSGCIVNYGVYTNSTRIRLEGETTTDYTLFSWNFTKAFDSSTSDLIIEGLIPTNTDYNGSDSWFLNVNGTRRYQQTLDLTYLAQAGGMQVLQTWTGVSAGTVSISVGWASQNGSNHMPANVYNPNSSDDGRNRQQGTVFTMYEVRK
jgi:hypothetical protein